MIAIHKSFETHVTGIRMIHGNRLNLTIAGPLCIEIMVLIHHGGIGSRGDKSDGSRSLLYPQWVDAYSRMGTLLSKQSQLSINGQWRRYLMQTCPSMIRILSIDPNKTNITHQFLVEAYWVHSGHAGVDIMFRIQVAPLRRLNSISQRRRQAPENA